MAKRKRPSQEQINKIARKKLLGVLGVLAVHLKIFHKYKSRPEINFRCS